MRKMFQSSTISKRLAVSNSLLIPHFISSRRNNTFRRSSPDIGSLLRLFVFLRMKSTDADGCKCISRSQCLNGHCSCFAGNVYCGEHCLCLDCLNGSAHVDKVSKAQAIYESRKPGWPGVRCSCLKSGCLTKICACFAAKGYCAEYCDCNVCTNSFENKERVNQMQTKLGYRELKKKGIVCCGCKTSRCLVPQCRCRTASTYCKDTCVCVNCYNRAELQNKRWCKCENSKCDTGTCPCRKFCVGCSDECECEGCTNTYGKRGEGGNKTGDVCA